MPNKRILNIIPLVFWVIIIIIKLIRLVPLYEGEGLIFGLNSILITSILDIITFSFVYYLILPNIISRKRITLSFSITLLYWLLYGILWSVVYKAVGRTENFEENLAIYEASLGHTLLSSLYAVVLRLSVDWVNKYKRQKELEKANRITELALLRSQINPHFLFNTLNNINSFSTHDPEKTSFAIIKLSELMRYMLYDAASEKVLLEKEIDHIDNFIALQKLRYKESDFVKFMIIGNPGNILIPPMIFLPFIENAFKHGSVSIINGIEISISIEGKQISFHCKNRVKKSSDTEINREGGLGIKNIKRRLELLFPGKYKLDIINENMEYIVNLIIHLDEY